MYSLKEVTVTDSNIQSILPDNVVVKFPEKQTGTRLDIL